MMSDRAAEKQNISTLIKTNIRNYSMFLILVLIMIVFGFLTNWINFSPRNISYIFIQYSYVLILAVGMVQAIIIGGIDLSVGSVCAFVGAISAMIYNTGVGMPLTLLASLVIGLAIGAFQGVWIAYARIPAFIVTLAGMLLFRGLTYIITGVNPIALKDDRYKQLASGTIDVPSLQIGPFHATALILGLIIIVVYAALELTGRAKRKRNGFDLSPAPVFFGKLIIVSALIFSLSYLFSLYRGLPTVVVVLGVTVLVFQFMMKNTILGRYIYAVGGNARSAKLSGINSELIVFVVFCIMGLLSGLAAVVSTGYMNSALPQAGNLFEMDAIAACYIGGVSASGGIGTVVGVIVGGLVMSAINNGMSLMNLGQHYQYVVKAVILLLAVFYDVYTRRKAGLG
jgi:putative multiple sugar transport system permease protein